MTNNDAQPQLLFHIAEHDRWKACVDSGKYSPASLATEGFIHCSYERQVQRSLDKFFASHDEVILLEIDPVLLRSGLKVEPADGDSFPHIYGEINTDAVVVAELIIRDGNSRLTFNGR
ncbi:MAG: DUF952 domain-containing protein [bacterium]|nr:DUF952 domain-containing protein [Candidatus Kapabacteria bacterium]